MGPHGVRRGAPEVLEHHRGIARFAVIGTDAREVAEAFNVSAIASIIPQLNYDNQVDWDSYSPSDGTIIF